MFASPRYECQANLYVDPKGADSNDGSAAHPWATIQHATDAVPKAGTCINLSPGVYNVSNTISLNHGGGADTPAGYVVYRSTTLGGAVLKAMSAIGSVISLDASFLMLDGVEVDGNATGCGGMPCTGFYNVSLGGQQNHHRWVTNTYSHGGGGGGIGAATAGDCVFIVHNVTTDNALTTNNSGISIWEPTPVPGLTSCGASPFHLQVLWNVSAHNMTLPGVPTSAHTDGDGIIMDTFSAFSYTYPSLVADNVAYDNGGFCVGQDDCSNITFANNTCFSNSRDDASKLTFRAELWNYGGQNITFVNNLVQAVLGADYLASNRTVLSWDDGVAAAAGITFSDNILFGPAPVDYTQNKSVPVSAISNKLGLDPMWLAPAAANFALAPGSPAVGYGATPSFLPATSVDVGACAHSLTTCPSKAY